MSYLTPVIDVFGFDGQSLAVNSLGDQTDCYPYRYMQTRTHAYYPVPLKTCNSGSGWSQRAVDATNRIDIALGAATGTKILIDAGGTTECELDVPAATAIATAEAYWTARKSAGWNAVYALTVPPSTGFDAGEEAIRVALNNLIRASTVLDGVLDTDTVPALATAGAAGFSDGTHFNFIGHIAVKDLILAEIP